MTAVDLERALCRVRQAVSCAIDVPEAQQRKVLRRLERSRFARRIDGPEEKDVILDEGSTALDAAVVVVRAERLDRPVGRLDLGPCALEVRGPIVPEQGTSQLVRTALGHDVDDAAGRLAEFRPIPGRLDLDVFDEVERGRVAERTENNRVGAERPVAPVRDVDAVDHVLVLEPGAARHGGVRLTHGAAAADAGRKVQRVADAPADRHALQKVTRDHRSGRCRCRIDKGRGGRDIHRFVDAADVQLERYIHGVTEADGDVFPLDRPEALKFRPNCVRPRSHEGESETSLNVGDGGLCPLRSGGGDGDAWHRQTLTVDRPARDGARGLLRCRESDADKR